MGPPPARPTPLTELPFALAGPGWLERACLFVPLLGWVTAGILETRRRTPVEHFIGGQIEARTEDTGWAWGDDPVRQRVAAEVSQSIEREFGWPNSHYLPEDRMEFLTFSVGAAGCGGELLFFIWEVEHRLGVKIVGRRAAQHILEMTLGEFVDDLVGCVARPLCVEGDFPV